VLLQQALLEKAHTANRSEKSNSPVHPECIRLKPRSSYAEVAKGGLKKSPGRPAVPAFFCTDKHSVTRTSRFTVLEGKTLHVCARGTSLPVSTVKKALRN